MALKPGQEKCINTLDRPIVVAAGAGSGKTFTLTKRIVHALECGYVDDIGQVCAITFTNKAAAELKSRVKSELRACGMAEQSLKADDAWISTIHGMCARILRSHAVELDLDPSFKMADAALAQRLLDQAVEEVLSQVEGACGEGDEIAAASPGALAALFAEYPATSSGFGSNSVEDMIRRLIGLAAADPRGTAAFRLPEFDVHTVRLVWTVADAFEYLLQAAEAEKPGNSRDDWMAATGDALAAARAALEAPEMNALAGLRAIAGFRCTKKFGSKGFKEQMGECSQLLLSCAMELRLAAATPHLRTLVALAQDALVRFQAKKRREGVLDNNDLLVLASRALEEHPAIAADYGERFRLVMVDEFQDTDQMQVDMIKRIAGPGFSRLCTVGDAQQSIYRFRGADVSVYRKHLDSVRALDADGIIELPDNFRSHADVLSLVDRVFERADMFGGEFMSLKPGRDEAQVKRPFPQGVPRIRIQQVSKAAYKGVPTAQVVQEQARQVALAFADLRQRGIPAGDMAVLLGRMANADVYARALREQGMACVVSGGSVFAQSAEADMILALARVAANPGDTESLWKVLSGPMFEISDADLLLLATGEEDAAPRRRKLDAGLWVVSRLAARGKGAPPDVSAPLACAVRTISALCQGAVHSRLSASLMRAVVDSGWTTRLQQRGPEGLAAAGNVYKAIRMVQDVEEAGAVGPVGAMRGLEQALALAKEAPGALSTTGGDFVRIMTVHASKGLEFPVVAVSEFKDAKGDSSKLLALSGNQGIVLSLDLGQTPGKIGGAADPKGVSASYAPLLEGADDEEALKARAFGAGSALELRAAIWEQGRLGDEEEAKRLLYVALTRAKECLVVSLAGARGKDNPNGVPKNCLGALALALERTGAGFEPGATSFPFGGSADAVVEHLALEAGDGPDAAEAPAGTDAPMREDRTFMVPAVEPRAHVTRVPFQEAHEGIFSYSSVSDASHAGDFLAGLASRFAVSCDGAAPMAIPPEDKSDVAGFGVRRKWEDMLSTIGGEDDGSWAYLAADASDADKATDLGTAFHRLAQHAVDAWPGKGPLAPPSPARVRAMVRSCGLDGRQWTRLDEALERWFGSDEAAIMSQWDTLAAEVPFMMPVRLGPADAAGNAAQTVFLEGEIDLLALDAAGEAARVVDYKTGGHPDEEPQALREKHVLQASCYAYALLCRGMKQVEASFVRVERGREDDPSQPQCVRYRFTAEDKGYLEQSIAHAYTLARAVG